MNFYKIIIFILPPLLMSAANCYAESSKFQHAYKFQDCKDCPEMVVVKGGTFIMGAPENEEGYRINEGPQHRVHIDKFAVGQFEVTFDEWEACVKDGGCGGYTPKDQGWGRGKRPVIYISWDDAKAYTVWLTGKTGKTYRLLTEAQWEYVARAGSTTPFWWGISASTNQANYDDSFTSMGDKGGYRGKTVPVDSFKANPWGLYNVHGNVWEWVEDHFHKSYRGAPTDGQAWVVTSNNKIATRVMRGGSWLNPSKHVRSAVRNLIYRNFRANNIGFRVARIL